MFHMFHIDPLYFLAPVTEQFDFLICEHDSYIALCGKSNEKSSSAVFSGNFAIDMGVHPSRLQIKKN